jgi:hypothetical protein
MDSTPLTFAVPHQSSNPQSALEIQTLKLKCEFPWVIFIRTPLGYYFCHDVEMRVWRQLQAAEIEFDSHTKIGFE